MRSPTEVDRIRVKAYAHTTFSNWLVDAVDSACGCYSESVRSYATFEKAIAGVPDFIAYMAKYGVTFSTHLNDT